MQSIPIPIQRILLELGKIFLQDVSHRGAANPVRHGMLGERTYQTIQRHGFGQNAGPFGKSRAPQDRLHAQLAPHLMSRMHRTGRARFFDLDPIRLDLNRGSQGDDRRALLSVSGFLGQGLDVDRRCRQGNPARRTRACEQEPAILRRVRAPGHPANRWYAGAGLEEFERIPPTDDWCRSCSCKIAWSCEYTFYSLHISHSFVMSRGKLEQVSHYFAGIRTAAMRTNEFGSNW